MGAITGVIKQKVVRIDKPLPKENVLCIDPHNATGLINTLQSEFRLYKALPTADCRSAIRYAHPHEGSSRFSGTGLFIAGEGLVVFATAYGTTYQVAEGIVQLVGRHLEKTPIILYEQPIPQNPILCQTAGFIVGYLLAMFGVMPAGLSAQEYDRRHFNRFCRHYGIEIEPTPHEVDAYMLYHRVYTPTLTDEEPPRPVELSDLEVLPLSKDTPTLEGWDDGNAEAFMKTLMHYIDYKYDVAPLAKKTKRRVLTLK